MNTKEAKQELKKAIVIFRALKHMDEVAEALEGAEDAAEDARKEVARLQKSIADLKAQEDSALAAVKASEDDAKRVISEAQEAAEKIVLDAVEKARCQEAEAVSIVLHKKAEADNANVRLSEIKAKTEQAEKEHLEIQAVLSAAKEKLKGLI